MKPGGLATMNTIHLQWVQAVAMVIPTARGGFCQPIWRTGCSTHNYTLPRNNSIQPEPLSLLNAEVAAINFCRVCGTDV